MRKLLIGLALALSLAGCTTLQAISGATITQSQVDFARNTYDGGFLAGLHRYALLPRCTTGQTLVTSQCHDAVILKKLRAIDVQVAKDFDDVQSNLDSGNKSALLSAWTLLQNAISSANSLSLQLGL